MYDVEAPANSASPIVVYPKVTVYRNVWEPFWVAVWTIPTFLWYFVAVATITVWELLVKYAEYLTNAQTARDTARWMRA
jgi:hypothetical protein